MTADSKTKVVKVIHQYSPEYPDDSQIKRTIHVMENGEEKVVFDATKPNDTTI